MTNANAIPATTVIRPARLRRDQLIFGAAIGLPAAGAVAAIASLPRLGFTALDLGLFAGFYVLTVVGIEVGYHRLFSHGAFVARPALRAALAICGAMAMQGTVVYWASQHRHHHRFADTTSDLHTPYGRGAGVRGRLRGIWHAHLGWIFSSERATSGRYAKNLLADPIVVRIDRLYYLWMALSVVAPVAIAGVITRDSRAVLRALLWAGAARIFVVQHISYAISSLCHMFGTRPFSTGDRSTNNALLALPTLGGAWHNNHHAFPFTATNQLRWWQLDPCAWVIRALVACGFAQNAKRPSRRALETKRTRPSR